MFFMSERGHGSLLNFSPMTRVALVDREALEALEIFEQLAELGQREWECVGNSEPFKGL
eukprot:SAG31_NODE_439_length_15675_cov_6.578390_18_plen_59_part_00